MQKLPPLAAIRAFESAGRLENFSRAAEELGLTQAAVSYQIRQLEDRLGHPLFVREKGRVRLSETGQRLLPAVSGAFAAMAESFAALRGDDDNVLTISAAVSFGGTWISSRIGRFQLRHPDLAVRLTQTNMMVDFATGGLDVGLRVGMGQWPGLRADFLFRSHVAPICSPAFLAEHRLSAPVDLLRVERVAPSDPWWSSWLAETGIGEPLPPRAGIEFDSQIEEASAVQGGYGIALMSPLFWRAELDSGRLVQPFDTLFLPGSAYYLVHRESRVGVRKIERFREWLREELEADRHLLPERLWEPLP